MPFTTNVYYSNPAIGRGVENLAAGLFGNPAQDASMELTLSRARQIQQDAQQARETRVALSQAADLFRAGDYSGGMGALLSSGDASYAPHLGSAALAFNANRPGATDDEIRRSFIGSGRNPSADFATTAGRADDIAARDAAAALRQATSVQGMQNAGALERARLQAANALERDRLALDNPRTLEALAAMRAQAGEIPLGDAARMFNPLSVDQRIASEAPSAEEAGILRGYRDNRYQYGVGDTTAAGGEGGAGAPSMEDSQRRLWATTANDEINNALADMGVDAGVMDRQTRQEILNYVIREAPMRPDSNPQGLALEAMELLGITGAGTGWFDGDPRVQIGNPGALMAREAGGGPAPGPQTPAPAGNQMSAPDVWLRMPDGHVATPQEILETARNRGLSPAEVIDRLRNAGGREVPGGA